MEAGSRPASAASSSSVWRPSLIVLGEVLTGSQPSPHSTVRLNTFLAEPPSRTGGWGCWAGLGKHLTAGKS